MTVAAERRALDMVGWPRCRLDGTDGRMTARTCRAGPLELATGVTTVAAHICVGINEVEAGTEVIEGLLRAGRRRQGQGKQQHETAKDSGEEILASR